MAWGLHLLLPERALGSVQSPEQKEEKNGGPVKRVLMLASIAALPIVVLLAFYASLNVTASDALLLPNFGLPKGLGNLTARYTLNYTTGANASYPSSEPIPSIFPTVTIPPYFLTALIIVVLVIISVFLIRSVRMQSAVVSEFSEEDYIEKQRNEVADILDKAVFQLRQGQEYRQTVLECYRRICEILEDRSKIDGRPLTAREFETSVSALLKLNSVYLSRITDIFELARYSRHEISKDEADGAIDCLTNLSAEMRDVSGI
jgi:hypothetical protein